MGQAIPASSCRNVGKVSRTWKIQYALKFSEHGTSGPVVFALFATVVLLVRVISDRRGL